MYPCQPDYDDDTYADVESLRLLSQRLAFVYETQPHLRAAVMALYAPILAQHFPELAALTATPFTTSPTTGATPLATTTAPTPRPADQCGGGAAAPALPSFSTPTPTAATSDCSSTSTPSVASSSSNHIPTLRHIHELLTLLQEEERAIEEIFDFNFDENEQDEDEDDENCDENDGTRRGGRGGRGRHRHSAGRGRPKRRKMASTEEPLPVSVSGFQRLLGNISHPPMVVGSVGALTEVPSIVASTFKHNLQQLVTGARLPIEVDGLVSRVCGWFSAALEKEKDFLTSAVWTKLAEEIDVLVGLPGSVRDKVAVVQQRGAAIKDASTTALIRVYDDARYVWAVNENEQTSYPGKVWGVGLLVLSNVLLTISMTTWSAALVCSNHAGHPARA